MVEQQQSKDIDDSYRNSIDYMFDRRYDIQPVSYRRWMGMKDTDVFGLGISYRDRRIQYDVSVDGKMSIKNDIRIRTRNNIFKLYGNSIHHHMNIHTDSILENILHAYASYDIERYNHISDYRLSKINIGYILQRINGLVCNSSISIDRKNPSKRYDIRMYNNFLYMMYPSIRILYRDECSLTNGLQATSLLSTSIDRDRYRGYISVGVDGYKKIDEVGIGMMYDVYNGVSLIGDVQKQMDKDGIDMRCGVQYTHDNRYSMYVLYHHMHRVSSSFKFALNKNFSGSLVLDKSISKSDEDTRIGCSVDINI